MTNYSKMALISIVTTLIGLILTILLFFLILYRPILFWFLIVIIWIILSSISGILVESYKECALTCSFNAILNFVILVSTLLIFNTLANDILELFNIPPTTSSEWGMILSSFLTALLITIIIFGITILISLNSYLIKDRIKKSQGKDSSEIEHEFYTKYETSSDEGYYHRKKKEEDFQD